MQLRDYHLLYLQVEVNPNFKQDETSKAPSKFGVNFNFSRQKELPIFKVELDVAVNLEEKDFANGPYRIRIKLQSFIEFDPSFPESEIPKLLPPNALAMTYSIARGIVGQATGTSLHNKFLLPTVNFIELIKDKIEREKKKKKAKRK